MSHSMDDRERAEDRTSDYVPLDEQPPAPRSADAWSGTEMHYGSSTGEQPAYRPDPLTDPLPAPPSAPPNPPTAASPPSPPNPPGTWQPVWDQPRPPAVQQPGQVQLPPDPGPQHYASGYAPVGPPAVPHAGPPAVPPAALPPVVLAPRPEDLLVPNQSPISSEPASWGWRGRLHRASGGLVKPKAAPAELQIRQAIHDIQRSYSRPMTVVVVQPKGGAGKTPTTICLAAAFGANRGGYVVGWDDNETRGTLAVRVTNPDDKNATVWDLLSDLAAFERFDARVGDLSHYVRSQPDAHFDALVSDDNPGNMSQIGEDEYQRLHKVLQRFYRMIVVDTGNNVRSPNWQAAVNSADLVVVVSSYQRDVGYSGSWVLDHLAQTGREELARNAVTVLTAADPTTDKVVRGQLIGHFTARTRAVIEIPYDPALAHGGPIRWNELATPTRNAWIQAGATIANCLAEKDQRAMAERRG